MLFLNNCIFSVRVLLTDNGCSSKSNIIKRGLDPFIALIEVQACCAIGSNFCAPIANAPGVSLQPTLHLRALTYMTAPQSGSCQLLPSCISTRSNENITCRRWAQRQISAFVKIAVKFLRAIDQDIANATWPSCNDLIICVDLLAINTLFCRCFFAIWATVKYTSERWTITTRQLLGL